MDSVDQQRETLSRFQVNMDVEGYSKVLMMFCVVTFTDPDVGCQAADNKHT